MRIYSSFFNAITLFCLSRSDYYKWRMASQRADSEADITAHIKVIHSMRLLCGYHRMTQAFAVKALP